MKTLLHCINLLYHEVEGNERFLILLMILLGIIFVDTAIFILLLLELFSLTTLAGYHDQGRALLLKLQQKIHSYNKQVLLLVTSLLFLLVSCYAILIVAIFLKTIIYPTRTTMYPVSNIILTSIVGLSSCIWMIPNFIYHLFKQANYSVTANRLWHYFVAIPGALLTLFINSQQLLPQLKWWIVLLYLILASLFLLTSIFHYSKHPISLTK